MTIAKDFAAKTFVAFVAVAMLFSLVAPLARAQSSEDLQKMINDLLAQVAALQGQGGTSGSVASGVCPFTWTRDLKTGATGADVMKLQQFLNSNADTRVAASGAGSVGAETEYFGPATAAAVSKFQVMHRADILSPAGLVNPTGFFGPSTRAKANSLCVTMPDGGDDDDDTTGGDDDDDTTSGDLQGEASLDTADLEDGESTIEEGDEDVVIGEFTVEFTDGDAEITRIDVTLDGTLNAEPWEAFDAISLWVDGEKIAEVEAADEDDYLDEDAGELRFTGLDLVAMEDEELEILVGATVQNNLDSAELVDWTLDVSALRFFDADGVADTVTGSSLLDSGEVAEFEIQTAGTDEELDLSLSSSNPDATDIVVDTDTDTNDVTIMVADIEAKDNDIELNTVVVKVEVTSGYSTTTATSTIDEVTLEIDGQSFDAEPLGNEVDMSTTDVSGLNGLQQGYSEKATATTSVWYLFDIDGDVVIDEDSEVQMSVIVDLNDNDDGVRYPNGTKIKASVASTELDEWEAEGAEDLGNSQFDGSAVGDEHTLVAEGILVPVDGFSSEVDTLGTNDTIGEFTLEFEVTAVEGDFYITEFASTSATTNGVQFTVDGAIGTGSVSASMVSTGDEDTSGVFTVREGETEAFTLTVTVDPQTTGTFRVQIDEIWYSANSNGTTNSQVYLTTPVSDYRTASQAIQGS